MRTHDVADHAHVANSPRRRPRADHAHLANHSPDVDHADDPYCANAHPTTPTTPRSSVTTPVLTVADPSLSVAGRGGTVGLGTNVSTTDTNDRVTVNITGPAEVRDDHQRSSMVRRSGEITSP